MASSGFTTGILLRGILACAMFAAAIEVFLHANHNALALVVFTISIGAAAELIRYLGTVDRSLTQFVDGLISAEVIASASPPLSHLAVATDRVMAMIREQRLDQQRRNDHYRALLDNVPAALFIGAPDDALRPMNKAALRMTGIDGISSPKLGPEDEERLRLLASGDQLVLRLKNGQRMLASIGRWSAAGTSHRLVSLQNADQALVAAEAQAWQDLARVLAHEIMNSLTPIATLSLSIRPILDRLVEQAANQPTDIDARDVAQAVEAIGRRSQGLMTFVERYRAVADPPRAQLKPVHIGELFSRLSALVTPTFQEKGIRLVAGQDAAPLSALGDTDLLEQALLNLMLNAADAVAMAEEPKVRLWAEGRGTQIVITVTDNGSGLPHGAADKIFVPFFSTKQGGSGIGLTLVRQIILAHNGQVTVSCPEPPGTVAMVTLPAA